MQIVLGSKSPRRSEILSSLGYSFVVRVSEAKEESLETDPKKYVLEIAKQKADNISISEDELLITADTVVVLDNLILGKPKDKEDAFMMLKALQDNTHYVLTAVCLKYKNSFLEFLEESSVTFNKVSDTEINAYIDTLDPMDKAGAYGIQGEFGKYVKEYSGDYFTIMGLPKERLKIELSNFIKMYIE